MSINICNQNILNMTLIEASKFLSRHTPLSMHAAKLLYKDAFRLDRLAFVQKWQSTFEKHKVEWLQNFKPHQRCQSNDGSEKYIIGDSKISYEALRMPIDNKSGRRITLCVSSQVGCALDCSFCVTGTLGLKRNLEAWEILEQVALANEYYPQNKVSNIVFMGMGEPFYNYDNVLQAVHVLRDHCAFAIANKSITVSTSGVVPRIYDWAKDANTHLAVSLIAADDEKRSRLMSINKRYPLQELLQSMDAYSDITGKQILCEYILMAGETDTQQDIDNLQALLKNRSVKLNLIPYNENETLPFKQPSLYSINRFQKAMSAAGIFTSVRWSYGRDINAACGQMSNRLLKT